MKLTIDGRTFEVSVAGDEVSVDGRSFRVRTEGRGALKTVFVNEQPFRVRTPADSSGEFTVLVDAKERKVRIEAGGSARRLVAAPKRAAAPSRAAVQGGVVASMAGRILRVPVENGQAIASGDLLLVFEAMKMENEVRAAHAGVVKDLTIKAGDCVTGGDLMLVIE